MKWLLRALGCTVAFLLAASSVKGSENPHVRPAMIGLWTGGARPIVTWCDQDNIPVTLQIHADGAVTGRVGDAELVDARIAPKDNFETRILDPDRTLYLVRGRLNGPVVADEDIVRARIFIHLRFDDARCHGSFSTDGGKFGGRAHMAFTATPLQLVRLE